MILPRSTFHVISLLGFPDPRKTYYGNIFLIWDLKIHTYLQTQIFDLLLPPHNHIQYTNIY